MEYIKTFAFAAIFIFLSIVCVINLINGRKEEKAAKEERKRKRSPFAGQAQIDKQSKPVLSATAEPNESAELDMPESDANDTPDAPAAEELE